MPADSSSNRDAIGRHYGPGGLHVRVQAALTALGKEEGHLTTDDLAPLDQFHVGGMAATLALAERAGIRPGARVLDVGGGLGGPARALAETFGCHVTVLDLTPEFCEVGAWLTERAWLTEQVRFQVGDATAMPFPDASFDATWTQHSSMNIPDKATLYGEIARVLRRGGRLALHEVMAGPGGQLHCPVPWASASAHSFLRPPAETRAAILAAGFRELTWQDTSEQAAAWFRERLAAARAAATRPPLGLHTLLGEAAGQMARNFARNLDEGRVVAVQAAFERQ
ncbi:MAG: methyltransferase domain-containing protein [Chloroflexi bacterium]|nr:methyltransferase domain-containing protein [Chloroflexota bacterium]